MLVNITPGLTKPRFESVQINRGHPLARSLLGAWLHGSSGGFVPDIGGRYPMTAASLGTNRLTYEGTAVQATRPNSVIDSGVDPGVFSEISGFQMIQGDQDSSTGQISQPFFYHNRFGFSYDHTDVNFQQAWFVQNSGGIFSPAKYTTTLVATKVYRLGATWDGATLFVYQNGIQEASAGTTGTMQTTADRWAMGSRSTFALQGRIVVQYIWNRTLSASEHRWLASEPYAFFRPIPTVRYWMTPPAAAAAAGSRVSPRSLALLGVGS